jgi:hypothetical protein
MRDVMLSFQWPNHLPFLNTSEFAKDDVVVSVKTRWDLWPMIIHEFAQPIGVTASWVYVQYHSIPGELTRGFIMRFSFHPNVPLQLPNGTWDCSAEHYATWSHHVSCNLAKECSDGRDEEGPCPYSGAGCGPGMVASSNKCFFALRDNDVLSFWDDDSMSDTATREFFTRPNKPKLWNRAAKLEATALKLCSLSRTRLP